METFVPALAMLALVKQGLDWIRYLRSGLRTGDWNGVITQTAAWGLGVFAVWITAQSDWAAAAGEALGVGSLAKLNLASQILFGLMVGSGASLTKDAIKAVDGTQSAAVPHLLNDDLPALRR